MRSTVTSSETSIPFAVLTRTQSGGTTPANRRSVPRLARDRQDQHGDARQHFRLFRTARIPGNSPDARMQLYAPQVTRVLMVRVDVRGLLRIP